MIHDALATSYDNWQRHSTSLKLTGMERQADRQADRQTGKPMFWEAEPPKINIAEADL